MKKVILLICFCIAITTGSILKTFSEDDDIPAKDLQTKTEAEILEETYRDDRLYSDVCWLTSHNSFAYREFNINLSSKRTFNLPFFPNQDLSIKKQLEYGVKSFMIDLHYSNLNIHLKKNIIIAHEGILFRQDFLPFLQTIKDWLDTHENDIITIHFESYIGDYNGIMQIIKDAELNNFLFDLNQNNDEWPTLGQMRNTKKRLVIFSDKEEDVGPGIMSAQNHTMETQYNLSSFKHCEKRPDRSQKYLPSYDTNKPEKHLPFIMNHFYPFTITIPAVGIKFNNILPSTVATINSYKKIISRACECANQERKLPNFIAVDFVGSGGEERKATMEINEGKIDCYQNETEKPNETNTIITNDETPIQDSQQQDTDDSNRLQLKETAEALPPKYLTVPNFKQCLGTTKTDSATFWCIPNEKPEGCPDSSWTELDEIGSIPKC